MTPAEARAEATAARRELGELIRRLSVPGVDWDGAGGWAYRVAARMDRLGRACFVQEVREEEANGEI